MDSLSVWVVIPAYNESQVIGEVLRQLLDCNQSYNILVVDDGSSDDTVAVASGLPVYVLVHPINLGQGAALATGFEYVLREKADIVVTFDADGQMCPQDISALVEELTDGEADVVLGSRFLALSPEDMPPIKKVVLKLATMFTRIVTGLKITDTHNGLRAFKSEALQKIRITQNQMAHSSEILSEIARNKLVYKEIPVTIRYTSYSKSKGQSVFNSINILFELLMGGKK